MITILTTSALSLHRPPNVPALPPLPINLPFFTETSYLPLAKPHTARTTLWFVAAPMPLSKPYMDPSSFLLSTIQSFSILRKVFSHNLPHIDLVPITYLHLYAARALLNDQHCTISPLPSHLDTKDPRIKLGTHYSRPIIPAASHLALLYIGD